MQNYTLVRQASSYKAQLSHLPDYILHTIIVIVKQKCFFYIEAQAMVYHDHTVVVCLVRRGPMWQQHSMVTSTLCHQVGTFQLNHAHLRSSSAYESRLLMHC